ncbi:MAG TPA: NUDIX pyrophosphatase [Caulobacteraceae bacterium]|nr:NUDIX pyrophosphatase [Caulobacteraceae bacterium]
MARAPLNVLVFPFRRGAERVEYALFRRSDDRDFWQGVAGGAEDDETPLAAAVRELREETGLGAPSERWIALETRGSVPAKVFRDWPLWGPETYVVHKHAFGVDLSDAGAVVLSAEHTEVRWLDFEAASTLTRYDSDRTALWELNERLGRMTGRPGLPAADAP